MSDNTVAILSTLDVQHKTNVTTNDTPTSSSTSYGVDTRDFEQNTPLITAANDGNLEKVKELLGQGAHPDSQNIHGHTPLLSALTRGNLQIAALLITRGANVHLTTLEGGSPLHFAAIRDETLVQSLANGAFLNVADDEGDTVLHWVIREQNHTMLGYLLQKGCNPDIANEDGETPLHLAASLGEDLHVDCLLKHGANATLLDSNGLTPLDAALESGEKKVIALLSPFKRPSPPRGARSSPHRCATIFNNYERKVFLSPHTPVSSSLHSIQEAGSSF